MKSSSREELMKLKNPFITNFTIKTVSATVTSQVVDIKDISDGIILKKPTELVQHYIKDREDYAKLFTTPAYRLHVSCLDDHSKSLFLWIMFKLDYQVDFIEITYEKFKVENKTNSAYYGKALKQLVEYGILTPTTYKAIYWINPFVFFKGDRLKKYPDNIEE